MRDTVSAARIRYADLPDEEQDEWDALDWGEDVDTPDGVTSEQLNKFLFNEGTVGKALAELMAQGHRVASGDRLGKTIVFAKTKPTLPYTGHAPTGPDDMFPNADIVAILNTV